MGNRCLSGGRMGVGPRYLSFLSIWKGRGLRTYTGWTTLPDLLKWAWVTCAPPSEKSTGGLNPTGQLRAK
jgi:hypothetical protein